MTDSQNITFEMDLAYENDISEVYTYFPESCSVKVLIEVGPGGDWPVCEISGPKTTIYETLEEVGFDTDDIDYLVYGE